MSLPRALPDPVEENGCFKAFFFGTLLLSLVMTVITIVIFVILGIAGAGWLNRN